MKKKSLKKVTSAVLVAAMSMGLLAGCGGSKSSEEAKTDADGATVIKFGIHVANPKKQETVTYNIVQGFNKENKGKYKVEFVAADTEAHSKNMKLAAQDGSLPEIVHLDSAEAPEYNEAGYLLDMSDFLKENKDIDDALDGMEDGLYFYRAITEQAQDHLVPGGWLLYEIGCSQGEDVAALLRKYKFEDIEIRQDLAGLDRVVLGRKKLQEDKYV